MGEMYNRSKQLQTRIVKEEPVTPRAEMKFQAQLKVTEHSAVFSSDGIAYVARVTYPLKQRRVNTETPECSCMAWMQIKVPCRHVIVALTGQGENQ